MVTSHFFLFLFSKQFVRINKLDPILGVCHRYFLLDLRHALVTSLSTYDLRALATEMTTLDPSVPAPRPLQVGEHVLCTLSPSSSDSPILAVVVALDKAYEEAAAHFHGSALSLSPSHVDGAVHNHAHVIDSATNSDQEVQTVSNPHISTVDTDDELHPYPVEQAPTKILFREADSRPHSYQSTPKQRPKKRRHEMPANVEALANANKNIKPDDTPAPHPITNGRVYVHFSSRDRRLDRWAGASEVQRASASHVAAAASGVVANRLLDEAVSVDLAVASANARHEPKLTRARRRAYEQVNPTSEKEIGNEAAIRMEKAREEKTKVRNVSTIVFGRYSIDAWYFSPFPLKEPVEFLYMCGKCLMYVRTSRKFIQHCTKCDWTDVPGLLLYEDNSRHLRVFEVSGVINPDYCQRLCLLGKLFLDHKTLFFDVTPFIFYIVTLDGSLAGFFSKEHPLVESVHNVACIVTLPPHQKKGIGRFLISLSYELTKLEGKTGSPERPLSDLGQVSYRSYWAYTITQYLQSNRDGFDKVPATTISAATGISVNDVIETLKSLKLVYMWRGETNADVSSRALDSAFQGVSRPRLPLHLRYLRYAKSSPKIEAKCSSALQASHITGTPRSRKQARFHDSDARRPTGISLYSSDEKPDLIGGTKDTKKFSRRRIEKFVKKRGRGRVLAHVSSPRENSLGEMKKISDEIGMTPKSCRENIRSLMREENMSNEVLGDYLKDEHRTVDISQVNVPGYEEDSFMLEDSVRKTRRTNLSSTAGAGDVITSFSDTDGVKFVERLGGNDGKQLELGPLRDRTRQVRDDVDIVVIDS